MRHVLHFSKIFVIESLPLGDKHTGKLLSEDIELVNDFHIRGIETEYVYIKNKKGFIAQLEYIKIEASEGKYPIIHIEAHGSGDKKGLILCDGSFIGWPELKSYLTAINLATKCNLLIVMGLCYGGYLTEIIDPTDRAPCWGLIGPTEIIYPDELLSTFVKFYSELLSSLDGDKSLTVLSLMKLCKGSYYFTTSMNFFKQTYSDYLRNYCSEKVLEERAKAISRNLRKTKSQQRPGKGALKRQLKRENKLCIVKFWQRFFMIDLFPENAPRFELSFQEVKEFSKKFKMH